MLQATTALWVLPFGTTCFSEATPILLGGATRKDVVAQLPCVGHVFLSDSCKFYLGKEKWDLAEWLSSSKRIDTVQSERGHYASPGNSRKNR